MSKRSGVKTYKPKTTMSKVQDAKFLRQAKRAGFGDIYGPQTMDFQMAVEKAVVKAAEKNAGYVDLAYAAYPLNTTGSITLIATIAQGVSVNQRKGKKALLKSLQLRGYAVTEATTLDTRCAFMIVYDREPTGALPAITDILVTATPQSFLNDVNSDRFQIVRRFDFCLSGSGTVPVTGNEVLAIEEYVKLQKRPIQFGAAATGAIGDISKGALYLVSVGNIVAGTADATLNLAIRTRFTDVEG